MSHGSWWSMRGRQRRDQARTDRRSTPPWPSRPELGLDAARPCRRRATCTRRSHPTASTRPWCGRSRGGARPARPGAAPAARAKRASRLMSMPGKMAPPRYSPLAEIASNVVAVPKSTTIDRAAEEVEGGDGVGDAVGADLLRVVVEDGDAGADAGLDDDGVEAEVALAHAAQRAPVTRGHRRAQHDAGDVVVEAEAVEAEELLDHERRARRRCARRWWRRASGRAGACRPGGAPTLCSSSGSRS